MNAISTFILYICVYPFLLCSAEYTNTDVYNYLSYSRCAKKICTPIIHSWMHQKKKLEECTPFIFTIKQDENTAQEDIKFYYTLQYNENGDIFSSITCKQDRKTNNFNPYSSLDSLNNEASSHCQLSKIKYTYHMGLINDYNNRNTNLKESFDTIRLITGSYYLANVIKDTMNVDLCEVNGDTRYFDRSPTVPLNELMPTRHVIFTCTKNKNDRSAEKNYNTDYPTINSNAETVTQDAIKSFKQRKFNQTLILSILICTVFIYNIKIFKIW